MSSIRRSIVTCSNDSNPLPAKICVFYWIVGKELNWTKWTASKIGLSVWSTRKARRYETYRFGTRSIGIKNLWCVNDSGDLWHNLELMPKLNWILLHYEFRHSLYKFEEVLG